MALGSQPYALLRLPGPDTGQKSEPGSPSHQSSSHLPLPAPQSTSSFVQTPWFHAPTPLPTVEPMLTLTVASQGSSADPEELCLPPPPNMPPSSESQWPGPGRAVLLGSRGPPRHTPDSWGLSGGNAASGWSSPWSGSAPPHWERHPWSGAEGGASPPPHEPVRWGCRCGCCVLLHA